MIRPALPLRAALLAAALASAGATAPAEEKRTIGRIGAGETSMRRGEIAYRKCHACHALEPGRNLEGPSLYRIAGKRVAAERGFAYSPALRALGRRRARWNTALLDRFIADPEKVAPRTSMNFHGLKDRGERADLIYYLERVGRR